MTAPRLTRDDEIAIHASGDVDRLAESHVDLARMLARRYAKGRATMIDDLTQEACIGLVVAARRWDPSFGVRFATYARHWAFRMLGEYLRRNRRLVALPNSQAGYRAAAAMASHDVADHEELAAEIGSTNDTAESLYALLASVEVGTERYDDDGRSYEWLASDSDPERDVIDAVDGAAIRHVVDSLECLRDSEREVIRLRYLGPELVSLERVSSAMTWPVSKQRAQQIEYQALRKLAIPLRRFAHAV